MTYDLSSFSDVIETSKLTFSIYKCVLDDRRLTLYPSVVEIIMCIKGWMMTDFKLQNYVVEGYV